MGNENYALVREVEGREEEKENENENENGNGKEARFQQGLSNKHRELLTSSSLDRLLAASL